MIGAGLVLASLFLNENSAPVISNTAAFIWIIFLMFRLLLYNYFAEPDVCHWLFNKMLRRLVMIILVVWHGFVSGFKIGDWYFQTNNLLVIIIWVGAP
jgi:hypothetical protein